MVLKYSHPGREMIPMRSHKFLFALLVLSACISTINIWAAQTSQSNQVSESVTSQRLYDLAHRAQQASDEHQRVAIARQIPDEVKNMHRGDLDRLDLRVVDAISALLRDDNDTVRLYAAVALGDIGTRARTALPALNDALEHPALPLPGPVPLRPDLGSDAVIPMAIKKINGGN
jgi:hypothetical protein